MKQRYIIALALFAGLLSSCTVQDIPMPDNDGLFTFHAESGEAPETKTTLQSGTLVHWCPQDEIHVFYGNASGRFVSTNTSVAATADFKGELPGLHRNDTDAFWAVYPYAQEQSFDGNTVTLSLPATQTAVEGTFADDQFLSMARSTNTDLRFYNVCGGIKFSVGIDGVKKVVFSGKNNEPLAGKVKVGFNDNLPKVSAILDAERTITVNAPNGGIFTPGAWYYLVSFPASLTQGYVMELYGDSLLDTKKGDSSVDIIRSVWGVLSDVGGESSGEDFSGLCLEAIEDGYITIDNPQNLTIEYSLDALNWISSNENPIDISMSSGDIVRFRGNNAAYRDDYSHVTHIQISSKCYIYGNVMSLVDAEQYDQALSLTAPYTFYSLFQGNKRLFNHPTKDILLPATSLTEECYRDMFRDCSNLTRTPELPSKSLAPLCYLSMFSGCTSLMTAPSLPATTLAEGCYQGMFEGCKRLASAPEISATILASNSCTYMFANCTGLITAPELPATTLAKSCYEAMFVNCLSLMTAPSLPASTLAESCYHGMFAGCTNLVVAPALPAIIMAESCYSNMFEGCISLETAPELPATTLANLCYMQMFTRCSSLVSAPELPATTLASQCYSLMFSDCTNLTIAPELPATKLAYLCYSGMFLDCSNLNYIKALFTTIPGLDYTSMWVSGVSSSGTFVKNPEATWDVRGANGIPEGWTVQEEGGSEFTGLSIEAIEDGAITISNPLLLSIEYSKDTRLWIASNSNPIEIQLSRGEIVRLRGNNTYYSSGSENTDFNIRSTVDCYVYGNVMSLVDANNYEISKQIATVAFSGLFAGNTHLINHPTEEILLPATQLSSGCYQRMFMGCTELTRAPSLPATNMAHGCYHLMFSGCTNLNSAPDLPATNLADDCYSDMFEGCTGLTIAPKLPASVLSSNCYAGMFRNCTSLTSAPTLPATSLSYGCYASMFSNCSSLTSAPELPATTLADDCYISMFFRCTNLSNAPALPATTLAARCYNRMFSGCTSLTKAPNLPSMSLRENCYSSMFWGCTSLTTAPDLPATSLEESCYYSMFGGCTSITEAPELPATELVSQCYSYMFNECTNLNYVKALFTTTPGVGYTDSWLRLVSSSGTFVKNPEATWDDVGVNGIPEGWFVENGAAPIQFSGLCLEAFEDGKITIANPLGLTIQFSKDARTWATAKTNPIEISVSAGDIVRFRGNNETYSDGSNHTVISCSSDCYVYGNVMSLVQVSGYETATVLTKPYTFKGLFFNKNNNAHLYNHPSADIILPATTLTEACYESMFDRCIKLTRAPELPATRIRSRSYASMFAVCSSLVTAPDLPATVLDDNCYYGMFAYCINLKGAPELPATIMAKECYRTMFFYCNSLTVAPELPATTLANSCYYNMFGECTSLIKAPDLPASYLPAGCYREMFYNCKKLNYIRCLATNVYNSLSYWVSGVATSGTFVQKSGVVWPDGESGIPSGWTVVFEE